MLADPTGPGPCSLLLTGVSILLILLTLPLSLTLCIKVRTQLSSYTSAIGAAVVVSDFGHP